MAPEDLDLADVLSAPLQAAADAQLRTALAIAELVRDLALEPRENAAPLLRTLDFTFEHEVLDERGRSRRIARTVQVPLLAMITLPSLEIERVEYRCRVRVNRTETVKSAEAERRPAALLERCPFRALRPRRRVTTAPRRSTRRGTEAAAPYDVEITVTARNEEPADGVDRLLTALAAAVREREGEEE